MKTFKEFLRKIDIFGPNFNFKYKTRDRYSTPFGGFMFLVFIALALTFGIYYLIPFIKRKNLSIIYYTMNIPATERIRLKDSQAAFAIGLDCEDKTDLKADDVFKLESRYILYIKDMSGQYNKNKTLLSSHKCKYEDFYGEYNTSFDYLGLKKYQCLDDYDHNIEGIYSDQVFSYYEFSLIAKNHTKYIEQYLKKNDCKLQIFYTDITIDLYNYKEPIKPFLNSFFIQLNPTLFIKRNVFFMNQYLYDDDELITVFDEEQKPKQMETLFSRYDEYSLYLGLDRENNKPLSVTDYAKIYIRADTKKTDIRRTYQKLTEFYADASSLLIAFYDFMTLIISFITNFYAEQAIIKKLFIFKEMDDKYFHFSKKSEKIHELVTLTNEDINLQFDQGETTKRQFKRTKSYMSLRKNARNYTYHNSNHISNIKNMETIDKEDHENKSENGNNLKQKTIVFSFNICEALATMLFPCCLAGQLKTKNQLNENAINILYNKLNVILYVRNTILFDIFNTTIIDEKKRDIINFLSRPILSNKNNGVEQNGLFYKNYIENDFDKFYISFIELVRKANKKDKEKRLINLSKGHLKELI